MGRALSAVRGGDLVRCSAAVMTTSTKIGLPWSEIAERWPDAVFFWDREIAPEGWDPLMLERHSVFIAYDSVLFADDRACLHASPMGLELGAYGCDAIPPRNWVNQTNYDDVWSKCKCRVWVGDRWITRRASLTWRSEVVNQYADLVEAVLAISSSMGEFGGAMAEIKKLPHNDLERLIVLNEVSRRLAEMTARNHVHEVYEQVPFTEARSFGGPAVFVTRGRQRQPRPGR